MLIWLLTMASCGETAIKKVDPIAHNESYDIWPDSIDLHDGVVLRAMSDSVMEVRVTGNVLDSITAGEILPGRMKFTSAHPLLDFLYRLEASIPSSGRYRPLTPYEIYLNPLQNDSATEVLRRRVKNGVILPLETHSASWPMINANAEWLMAASEWAVAHGDKQWEHFLHQTASTALATDNRMSRNPATGLYTGLPYYMAAGDGFLPEWMQPADVAAISTLGVNVAYAAAMTNIGQPADSLVSALKNLMWIPNMGYFSGMMYGIPTSQLPLQSTDNLAQSIAVISGILPEGIADAVIRKTPVGHNGVTLYHPQLPPARSEIKDEIPATLLQVARAVASARQGNEAAYSRAVGDLLAVEGKRLLGFRHRPPSFRSTFTTFILRGLLGIRFVRDGVFFTPYIPENLPGEKQITGLHYRKAILDIKINGTGKVISTFTIDDKPADPFIPGHLEGHHTIAITLAGAIADPGGVTLLDNQLLSPLPPVVTWSTPREASIQAGTLPATLPQHILTADETEYLQNGAGDGRLVYLNGVMEQEIFRDSYRLYDAKTPVVVQFTALVNSSLSSFSSTPYIYIPQGMNNLIYASELATTGTKVLEDKTLASKFVESNKFKNRNIRFDFNAPASGRYLVTVHYADGLGIVNGQRKLALRSLRVNGVESGVFFFTQRTSATATATGEKSSWKEMTAWSNILTVNLDKGENHLELRYFQPSPVYADPTSNVILIDLIKLIPID